MARLDTSEWSEQEKDFVRDFQNILSTQDEANLEQHIAPARAAPHCVGGDQR